MKNVKKLIALVMAVAMLFALAATASATYTDYLYPYDHTYVQRLNAGDISIVGFYDPFSPLTEAQAEAVTFTVVGDDFYVYLDEPYVEEYEDGYAAYVYFYVDDYAEQGAVSIQASYGGKTGNITVSVEENCVSSVSNITVVFKNNGTTLGTYNLTTLNQSAFYGNTSYPSALDTVIACIAATPSSGYAISHYAYDTAAALLDHYYAITSMTINSIEYDYEELLDGSGTIGWHYSVLRDTDASEVIDPDDFCLRNGDTVVWDYYFSSDAPYND